jgi:hypothetical protein
MSLADHSNRTPETAEQARRVVQDNAANPPSDRIVSLNHYWTRTRAPKRPRARHDELQGLGNQASRSFLSFSELFSFFHDPAIPSPPRLANAPATHPGQGGAPPWPLAHPARPTVPPRAHAPPPTHPTNLPTQRPPGAPAGRGGGERTKRRSTQDPSLLSAPPRHPPLPSQPNSPAARHNGRHKTGAGLVTSTLQMQAWHVDYSGCGEEYGVRVHLPADRAHAQAATWQTTRIAARAKERSPASWYHAQTCTTLAVTRSWG